MEIRHSALNAADLSRKFGVSRTSIRDILRGRTWPHVGGPRRTRQGSRLEYCKAGHRMSGSNVIKSAKGRECKACKNARRQQRRAIKKAEVVNVWM